MSVLEALYQTLSFDACERLSALSALMGDRNGFRSDLSEAESE